MRNPFGCDEKNDDGERTSFETGGFRGWTRTNESGGERDCRLQPAACRQVEKLKRVVEDVK